MFIYVHSCLKYCPSFWVSPIFQFFLAISKHPPCLQILAKTLRPLRCVSAANYLCKDVDYFRKPTVSLEQYLCWFVTFLYKLIYFTFTGLGLFP